MGCCDPAEAILENLIGVGGAAIASYAGLRRDVMANRGNASDYGFASYVVPFIEDRSASSLGDVIWVPLYNGASWDWMVLATMPPSAGGSPW